MEITDYIDVRTRIDELGLRQPDGIAILPTNLPVATSSEDLIYAASAEDVVKLLRSREMSVDVVSPQPFPRQRNHDFTLVLPVLFVATSYYSQNPQAIAVALGVVANYATHMLQGFHGGGKVRLNVVVETTKTKSVKRIEYEGPASGICDIARIVEQINEAE